MRNAIFMAALLLTGTAHATEDRTATPPVTDEMLNGWLEQGEEIETRADGDLNGDGDTDTVYIVASPDARTLRVMLSYRSDVDIGHEIGGELKLEPLPIGPAKLKIAKGVLTICDLTGGSTALSATYRYRSVRTAERPRMRLIGLDATMYSRTFAHDGREMGWNVATGDINTTKLTVPTTGDRGYERLQTRRFSEPARTIYMEKTPDPEAELVRVAKAE